MTTVLLIVSLSSTLLTGCAYAEISGRWETPSEEVRQEITIAFDDTQTVWVNDEIAYNLSAVSDGCVLVTVLKPDNYGCTIQFGNLRYTYLQLPEGEHVFPFSMGDGSYEMKIVRQINGTQYAVLEKQELQVRLSDEMKPFLISSYMVSFDPDSALGEKAKALSVNQSADKNAAAICEWVYKNIRYDTEHAAWLSESNSKLSENIPDPEAVFEAGAGICLDKAALTAAMLRAVGIPARLVFGDCQGQYHAWVEAYTDAGGWTLLDPTTYGETSGDQYSPKRYY